MGYRGRGGRGAYPGNGPFRDLPPWQRPGWLYGSLRGAGYPVDPTRCARFPWLPRWWWANPDYQGATPQPPSAEKERGLLEQQIVALEGQLDAMRRRLDEIGAGEKPSG